MCILLLVRQTLTLAHENYIVEAAAAVAMQRNARRAARHTTMKVHTRNTGVCPARAITVLPTDRTVKPHVRA